MVNSEVMLTFEPRASDFLLKQRFSLVICVCWTPAMSLSLLFEILPNIKSLQVFAVCEKDVELRLREDKFQITINGDLIEVLTQPFPLEPTTSRRGGNVQMKLNISGDISEWRKDCLALFEPLPEVNQLQNIYCRFCLNSLLKPESTISRVQKLPGEHWEEAKDLLWVCACNSTALNQSPVLPKDSIKAVPDRILIGEEFILVDKKNLSLESIFTENYDEFEFQGKKWFYLSCSRCMMPLGLNEISKEGVFSVYDTVQSLRGKNL
eukprot:TRINITY_DN2604_c0_g1_i8.p1 TRINITY_DN2604_c0_g1~~TRINITY_DN2604_c0_g1_i8.p1  ORF type:complete len:265 (-),score=35.27 TRINITY_DN2604_c0_g1_i8:1798-2592(-)